MKIVLEFINSFLWGPAMLVLILGTGLYLTVGIKFFPITKIPQAFIFLWRGRKSRPGEAGEVSSFNALMTALAATIGTGNIVGVATAIFIGGPGALFWMWITAFVGMATKYAETVLALKYREVTPEGSYVGGPMYTIKNGLGPKWAWLGACFSIFGALAGFGIGNTVQANSMASGLYATFGIPTGATAVVLCFLVGGVLLGGLKRIAHVAGVLVPFMALFYCLTAIMVIIFNISQVPVIFMKVVEEAFTDTAAVGGFAGATAWMAIRYGVSRGVFSNEAGMGSGCIAYASAKISNPVRMGLIGMLGTFIDSIVVCTITGFVILVTGTWMGDVNGAAVTASAFESIFPNVGGALVSISLVFFAYSTILGWSVYSERCIIYLLGERAIWPFRIIFIAVVPVGAILELNTVWLLGDALNAMMAIPNLISLILLSPVVFRLTKNYVRALDSWKIRKDRNAKLNK